MVSNGHAILETNRSISVPLLVLVGFCIWTILASAFVLAYHAQENTIYFWDNDNYPKMFRFLVRTWHVDGRLAVLRQMKHSLENDYTFLPSFLLLPLGLMFGEGRGVFLAGVASIYGFVAFGMTLNLYRALCLNGGCSLDKTDWYVASSSLAMIPLFWWPILGGYPDVLGMGIMSGILCLHLLKPVWERPSWQMISVGLLIAGLLWFRRWYCYFIAAAIISVFFDFIWVLSTQKQSRIERWKTLESLFVKGIIALGVTACLVLVFSPQQWLGNLLTSYRDLYASYRSSEGIFFKYYARFGVTMLLFLAVGLFYAFRFWGSRALAFLGVYLLSGFFLFERTQNIIGHHSYGFLPAISVIFLAGVTGLLKLSTSRFYKMPAAVFLVSLFALQLAGSTVPEVSQALGFFREAFPGRRSGPEKRSDLAEVRRLLDALENARYPDEKIYVLASSKILNYDILRSASDMWGYGSELPKHILVTQEVDSRDGFPLRFFEARLVVVANPVQLHLRPSEHRNVRLLYDKMHTETSFRSHFEKLPQTFNLDRQVEVSLYRLKQPFGSAEIQRLLWEYRGGTL